MRRRRRRYARQFYRQVEVGPRASVWPRLGLLTLLALGGYVGWWIGWSPYWRVDEVVVRGVAEPQASELASSFNLTGQNIFRLKLNEVEAAVSGQPTVASYEIVRQLPHRLIINLREREPALVWQTVGRYWLVDDTGQVFKEVVGDRPAIPLVIDTANIAVEPNEIVVPLSFMRTVWLLEESLPPLYGQPIREHEVGETIYDIDAIMADGRRVRLNILGNVASQLADLKRLAEQRPDLFARSSIDLRVDRWAYVK